MPTASRSDSSVRSRTSWPSTRTAPSADVVDARHEQRGGRLARARRPDQRDELARCDGEAHVAQDPRARVVVGSVAPTPSSSDGDRRRPRPTGGGTTRGRTRSRPTGSTRSTAPGRSAMSGGKSSTSKTRSNDDERGHHVDARVRELRERLVDLADVDHERGDGADRDRVLRSRGCRRRSRRPRCRPRRRSPSATNSTREYIAVVMPMSRTRPARSAKLSRSRSWLPNSFTTSAPATLKRSAIVLFIDALSCIALAGDDAAASAPDPRAGMMKSGQHDERQDREAPLEREHERERHDHRDDVRDDRAERVGDGLLRADDVVVQPATSARRSACG